MYREHAKLGLGAQSINLTSLNIYTDTGYSLVLNLVGTYVENEISVAPRWQRGDTQWHRGRGPLASISTQEHNPGL
jgi:hypothetical protein